MNNSIIFMIQLAPILAMLALIFQKHHFLMILLSLEGIMLSMVLLVSTISSTNSSTSNMLSIVLLSFGACEASLGLSLLVLLSRSFGSDLMKSLTMNKC